MPYIYRISRRSPRNAAVAVAAAEPEVPYRELQARAKELDIPANQTADDLKKAIAEAQADD